MCQNVPKADKIINVRDKRNKQGIKNRYTHTTEDVHNVQSTVFKALKHLYEDHRTEWKLSNKDCWNISKVSGHIL